MAKIMNCNICGKEIKKGFLATDGNAKTLKLTQLGGAHNLTCCSECEKKYALFAREDKYRFSQKLHNMKVYKRRVDKEEMGKMFVQYYDEAQNYQNPGTYLNGTLEYTVSTEKGDAWVVFNTKEETAGMPFGAGIISSMVYNNVLVSDKDLSLRTDEDAPPKLSRGMWAFSEKDVTKAEYIIGLPESFNTGRVIVKAWSLFPVSITLNDPTQMTYKPGIIEGFVLIRSSLTTNGKKVTEQAMQKVIPQLQYDLGLDNVKFVAKQKLDIR